jgi:hypothetical protein
MSAYAGSKRPRLSVCEIILSGSAAHEGRRASHEERRAIHQEREAVDKKTGWQ